MKKIIVMSIGLNFLLSGVCFAGDFNFETTSEDIIKKLSKPQKGGHTRSLKSESWENVLEPHKAQAPVKTRSIKVMRKEKGKEV